MSWNGAMKGVRLFGSNVFELFDFTSANILLPVGGFFIVMFVAWFFSREKVYRELSSNGTLKISYFPFFRFIIRFIAPVGLAVIFLNGIGLLRL